MGFNGDFAGDVQLIKDALVHDGIDLSGPDGAFQITKRLAFVHGLFLVRKTQGNNSHGYQVDVVAAADGQIADILRDAGGENGPQFLVQPNRVPLDVLAPAFNDWDTPAPTPDPIASNELVTAINALNMRLSLLIAKIDQLIAAGIKLHG